MPRTGILLCVLCWFLVATGVLLLLDGQERHLVWLLRHIVSWMKEM